MFIVSKRNYQVRRADGSPFFIAKDFIGEIPTDVAKSNLVQRAIRGGMIAVPEGTQDKQLWQADDEAVKKAAQKDIRPDAEGKAEEKTKAEESGRTERNGPDGTEGDAGKEAGKRSQKK